MPAEVFNIDSHRKIKTALVCSDCGAPGEGSCRCGAAYVAPGERAAAAVKANPDKTSRAIADEIGVGHQTVLRERKKAVGPSGPTEKRTGKDGKEYKASKAPKRRTAPEKFAAATQSRLRGKTQAEAAKEAGLGSVQTVKIAEAFDEGFAEALEQLNVDPATLSPTAKAKLQAAIMAETRKLNMEHNARMRGIDEEVRKRVTAQNAERIAAIEDREKEAWDKEKHWREMINNHKPPFSPGDFKLILMCLHPDGERTPEKLSSAFLLFNSKKKILTGER